MDFSVFKCIKIEDYNERKRYASYKRVPDEPSLKLLPFDDSTWCFLHNKRRLKTYNKDFLTKKLWLMCAHAFILVATKL